MKKLTIPIFLLSPFTFLFAQNLSISGIINHYAAVTAIDSCSGVLTVNSTTGFAKGDKALLIQMQGADAVTANTANYGALSNLNSAGAVETVDVDSVSATQVFLTYRLLQQYQTAGKVQLVRIPQYTDVTIADTLKAQPWNGSTGGVLALNVSGSLVMNAPINATACGFRGGADFVASGNGCSWAIPQLNYFYGAGNWRGANKGEGVALPVAGQELGRGALANGGGGGNDHNAGGGGGANRSNGGAGGNNEDVNTLGCNGYFPGLGGHALNSANLRLYMGGGGGAGHANNLLRSSGGRGGGIVVIQAGQITGPKTEIYALGGNGANSLDDGAGGGGAGGSLWLSVDTPAPGLLVDLRGGNGGNADNANVSRCMGPGGGGGGGVFLGNNLPGNLMLNGGTPGKSINSTLSCNNQNNDATAGETGLSLPFMPVPAGNNPGFVPEVLASPAGDTVCIGDVALFTVQSNPGNWHYQWQVMLPGGPWVDISNDTQHAGYQSDSLLVSNLQPLMDGFSYRCIVSRPGCGAVFSEPAALHVVQAPSVAFTYSIGQGLVQLSGQISHADQFIWDFGDGSTDDQPNPLHQYAADGTYTITLKAWSFCDTVTVTQTVSVTLPPHADFDLPADIIGCGSAAVAFTNQSTGNGLLYNWSFPGGNPDGSSLENPVINYSTAGTYSARLIVSNSAGWDTLIQTFEVMIFDSPQAEFTWQIMSDGTVIFDNTSQHADTYSWNFGDGSTMVNTENATHQYSSEGEYIVTLSASSPCGVSIMQQTILIDFPESHTTNIAAQPLRLFPNPARQLIWLEYENPGAQPTQIRCFDAMGRMVLEKNPEEVTVPLAIDVRDLVPGVYFITVNTGRKWYSGIAIIE